MTAPPLVARDLYRFYHAGDTETLALRGISLAVAAGETVVIAGPSGSGKSTLLSCLAGLDDPDGGLVRVNGEQLSRQPERVRARLRNRYLGIVYQQWNLFSHLTVAENVAVVHAVADARPSWRHPGGRVADRELLDALGIGTRASAYPATLSGGETARAALAVALAARPVALIADEPTGELDSDTEAAVLDLLAEQSDRGLAVVVASHSPAVARRADRVLELRDGQVAGQHGRAA